MSASAGTRVTNDEKSVTVFGDRQRARGDALRLEHDLGGLDETLRVRLLEVDQDDLLGVQLVRHEARIRRALDVVTRNDAEERTASPRGSSPSSATSASRTARCAPCRPRSTRELDAATAPDVLGPITASTDLFAIIFCATVCAIDAPCSTGVSPTTRPTLSPSFGARVFTAYFAQVNCSVPMKPAPPVTGVDEAELDGALAADGLARRCCRLSCARTGSEDRRRCGGQRETDQQLSHAMPSLCVPPTACDDARGNLLHRLRD